MRRLALTLGVVAVLLSGCTGATVDPPPPPPPPTRSAPDPCAKPTVRVPGVPPTPSIEAEPDRRPVERGTPTATGVYRRVIGGGAYRLDELLDAPVVPVLSWRETPPGLNDELVWAELVAQASVQRRPSEGLAAAITMMDGLAERPGIYVTYAGVGRRTVEFTAMCGGRLYAGRAETWTFSEAGAIECGLAGDPGGAMTRLVRDRYCVDD